LTGLLHRPAVEQELLGEGGLARVGVADDGEGAPVRGELGGKGGHATYQPTSVPGFPVAWGEGAPGRRRVPFNRSPPGRGSPVPAAPPVPATYAARRLRRRPLRFRLAS